ncbi:MAG: InlB B-repeat-containing protein [Lachnospiraceae bacterium]|nr:InlB B-repeat-containing protein [Lachnospiraceae bacterium]
MRVGLKYSLAFLLFALVFAGGSSAVRAAGFLAGETNGTYYDVPKNTDGYVIMPGDEVVFGDSEEVETKQGASGNYAAGCVITRTYKFMDITQNYYSNIPTNQSPTLTSKGTGTDYVERIENNQEPVTIYISGHIGFVNNTKYACFLSSNNNAAHDPIIGYEKNDDGAYISYKTIFVKTYTATWYPATWNIHWDYTTGGLVPDATMQGKDAPSTVRSVFTGGNTPYDFTVNNPVSAGRHFTCWTAHETDGSNANIGFENETDTREATEDGMSTTTIYYNAGKYTGAKDGQVTFRANWEDAPTVTYDANGGTINGQSKWIYEADYDSANSTFTRAGLTVDPKRSGYVFGGWTYTYGDGTIEFTNLNGSGKYDAAFFYGEIGNKYDDRENITVKAKWTDTKETNKSMTLNTSNIVIKKGKTVKVVKVTLKNDKLKSVTSGNKSVARASISGKYIEIKGVKVGKTKIKVESKSGITKTISVKVQDGKVTTAKISLSKSSVTLKKKAKVKVIATAIPDYYSTKEKIKLTVKNKKIAKASANNTAGVITITGKGKGKTEITVKIGKKKATINVKVK